MLKGLSSAKRLLSLTVSLVLILSLTLLYAPAVFAVEDPPIEYYVTSEVQFRIAYVEAAAIDRIFLNNDITLTEDISLNKNIPINCGSNTITVHSTVTCSAGSITANTRPFVVGNDGVLQVLPGATILGGEATAIEVNGGGSLLMSGGSIATGDNGILINGGEATITGGTIAIETNGGTGVAIESGSLVMSGGTINSSDYEKCRGVSVYSGAAEFTGGNIDAEYGVVAFAGGQVTARVPSQQLGGIFRSWDFIPTVTASPAGFTMQRGETRTVILDDADESFALYPNGTNPALNAVNAGPCSATVRPSQAGDYDLSFHASFEIGNGQASITLTIPVTVTGSAPSNPGSPSTPTGQGDDTPSSQSAQSPSVPSIPETGAGNLFLLLLLSVLCI